MKRVMLTGKNLKRAHVIFDQNNKTVVGFSFDTSGAKKFADITQKNVGKRFAIKIDDRVISAPNILSPILGGSAIITGGFTLEQAEELATAMNLSRMQMPKLTLIDCKALN